MANNVQVKKRPTTTVKSVSTPERGDNGSYQMTVNIDTGDNLVNKKNERRATRMRFGWMLAMVAPNGGDVLPKGSTKGDMSISDSNKKFSKTKSLASFNGYTRNSYYPYSGVQVSGISFWCQPYNKYGNSSIVSKTRMFQAPLKPTISAFSVNQSTGEVSCTITSDAGNGYRERARTRYKVVIENTKTKQTWTQKDESFTALTKSVTYDPPDYQQLAYGEYISVTVSAWNQGLAGDSETVSKTYYVSFPAATTINSVSVDSRSSTGKCTALINTNNSTQHPEDALELEYLANTTYADANDIPGTETWTASGIVDDGQCNALSMPVTNLIPDAGKYTWIRVRSEHAIPAILKRYSEPARVTDLETPAQSASDDEIKILSTALGADGESVAVHMGWNVGGSDDANGTELSWADAEDAWKSTEPPQTFDFDWSDGTYADTSVTPNVVYNDSATVTIKKLEPGQVVYIRARRFLDDSGERSYGTYSNAKAQLPSAAALAEPVGVVLSLPGFIANGESALASWTVNGGAEQKAWQLVSSNGKVIASGTGIANSYQIPFERLSAVASSNIITATLLVDIGGDSIASDAVTSVIVDRPTLTLTVGTTLTAQPLSFSLASNKACRIIASIVAEGSGGQNAAGVVEQYGNDTVWSAELQPEWTKVSTTSYTSTFTLDSGQKFLDGASYVLTVQAVDDTTGLKSDEKTATFAVSWTHQAIAPDDCVVNAYGYYDYNNVHHMIAEITIAAPTNAVATDVYDVYRLTGDGAVLIGSGYADEAVVTDEYAPFGRGMDLAYRICTRTVDGDEEFADIPYELDGRVLRFDWPYGVLELPYNIDIADGYSKSVQQRMHLDGAYNAYWNQGVKRTAKYSSQLVRLENQEDIALARQLARYPGGVFVRTPDGSAFEADVQINDLSTSGVIQTFSLSITEIETTDAYKLPPNESES